MVLRPVVDLFPDLPIGIVVLNIEVGLQEVRHRVIGDIPSVGETSSFKKGRMFIGDGLSELIEEPGLTDTRFGYNGDGLPPAFFRSLETIQQEFQLPFPSHEWGHPRSVLTSNRVRLVLGAMTW